LAVGEAISAWKDASSWADGGGNDSVGNIGAGLEAAVAGARLHRRRQKWEGAFLSEGNALMRQEMLIS
jgi:hypothetical protein